MRNSLRFRGLRGCKKKISLCKSLKINELHTWGPPPRCKSLKISELRMRLLYHKNHSRQPESRKCGGFFSEKKAKKILQGRSLCDTLCACRSSPFAARRSSPITTRLFSASPPPRERSKKDSLLFSQIPTMRLRSFCQEAKSRTF